jgi:hypothetical protein
MASIKKLSAPGSSQNFASSDVCSGNNKFSEGVKVMNWPYQGFTVDNEVSPEDNVFPPKQLSDNPTTFSDTGISKHQSIKSNGLTLG